jgi:hypothetical protein
MSKRSLPVAGAALALLLLAACEREGGPGTGEAPPPPPGISDPALTPSPSTLDHYGTPPDTLVGVPLAVPDTF